MMPSRLARGLSRRSWLRLGMGILGLLLFAGVAHRTQWREFRLVVQDLRWAWIPAGLTLGCMAMVIRALRLSWILDCPRRLGLVWRAMALGYLGQALLPMGGGELLKIGVLQSQLELPPASVVAGAFLDRLFDLLGLVVLVAILACTGTALPFRPGPRQTAILAGGMALLALSASFVLLARDRLPPKLGTMLNQALDVLRTLRRPAHAGRLLLAQGLITTLDVTGTYLALQAFPFGPTLPALIALKLSAYLMLSAALPLLPGGAGTLQIACLLALQPSGVSVSGAFAFSLVAQGMGIIVYGIMAAGVAFWPGEKTGIQALRRPGGTA